MADAHRRDTLDSETRRKSVFARETGFARARVPRISLGRNAVQTVRDFTADDDAAICRFPRVRRRC